ncbi:N-formylglutamate amidohydrolase [Neokomagataea anthophila]|uniref:N-formylglutamate amidohydrolase n=1 Tax=Neokomagataea anthophila TaxID=2826925 RepID=A0ABS5E6A6_9PROT|nr:N-formylglutamate amidohydrolase [Neokomagataea anthophila]MBR0559439.1 N-formylglutamate amidohydrolase [Neokomagataea anthophila]
MSLHILPEGEGLLTEHDPHPVVRFAEDAPSPFVLVSDHAGRAIPSALGRLGIPEAEHERHIAHDIGIQGVGRRLRPALGAALIEQCYSRLVIDCNRSPGHPTSIPPVSDGTPIPVNAALSDQARRARENAILHPYHAVISAELDARKARPTALIALHSFTPSMQGVERPWHAGVLFNRDARLSHSAAALLRAEGLCVGENEPYVLTETSDYTVPFHAEARGLPYLEIEIRQDLIADEAGQVEWAERLARLLPKAWEALAL